MLEEITILGISQQLIQAPQAARKLTFPNPYSTHLAKFLSVINALEKYRTSMYRFQFKL